jgi:hypothetical protein
MALEISYWAGRAGHGTPVYRGFISAESRSLSGTSAQSAATPAGAKVVRIEATEAARVQYKGTNPTADANSAYLASGGVLDIEAVVGDKVAGITA